MTEAEGPKQVHPAVQELQTILFDPAFEARYIVVQTQIDPAIKLAQEMSQEDRELVKLRKRLGKDKKRQLRVLREEVKRRKDDPALLRALEVWGLSPDADGNRGSTGQGLNAGVVHYFQYSAADATRAHRFSDVGGPSISDFIDLSMYLGSLLDQPDPEQNMDVQASAIIEDENSQKRLYLLTSEGFLVIGFQREGEGMKVISAGMREKPERFERRVQQELDGSINDGHKLNRLGSVRARVA